MDDLALYLRLAPEFGGTRFGPFEGAEVRLGTDKDKNDIVLAASLGVFESHLRILRQGTQDLILAPVDRSAPVFLYAGGRGRPKQVTSAVAIKSGDAIALVTENGPRFIVELDELPEEIKKEREESRRGGGGRARFGRFGRKLSGEKFKQEGKRQVWTRLLTTGPGQFLQRGYTFVASGQIFLPRNLIMLATAGFAIGGGWIFGGAQGCKSRSLKKDVGTWSRKYEDCEARVAITSNDRKPEEMEFSALAGQIIGYSGVTDALQKEDTLLALVRSAATDVSKNIDDYPITNPAAKHPYFDMREALMALDMEPVAASLLAYAATERPDQMGFSQVPDASGKPSCGRGPMHVTYRQARQLGLMPTLDALITKNPADFLEPSGEALRIEALGNTARASGEPNWLEPGMSVVAMAAKLDNGNTCLYIDSEEGDDRSRRAKLANSIERAVRPEKDGMPLEEENHYALAAVAMFYAHDMTVINWEERGAALPMTDGIGPALKPHAAEGQWVMERTAEVIARSVVIPCHATLSNKNIQDVDEAYGSQPDVIDCLVLNWKLNNE